MIRPALPERTCQNFVQAKSATGIYGARQAFVQTGAKAMTTIKNCAHPDSIAEGSGGPEMTLVQHNAC